MKEQEELLVIEPIIGYRSWNIYCEKVNNKFNFYLRGSGVGANAGNWQKGINIAKCLKKNSGITTILGKHQIPDFNCECGFYARKYKIDIIQELLKNHSPSNFLFSTGIFSNDSNIDLYGIVELTGKVIEHSEGYRAERAEIKKLIWANERDKIEISYEDKDKKVEEKKEEKVKKNNIQTKMPLTATAASILRPFYLYTQQQMQAQQAPQQTQVQQAQAQRGLPNIQMTSAVDLSVSKPSKTFAKEQIIKSLQDYYKVPIIYYKDYLEKELLR